MDQVSKYFNAEKNESILFIIAGILALVVAAYFLVKLKQPYYNGFSYALAAVALIQLTVGASVYFRSPKDIAMVNEIIKTEKQKIAAEEIPRMNTVMKNFSLYRRIEIALMITGLALFLYFKQAEVWKGLGTGVFIQAAIMLVLDFFAESRGKTYLDFLQKLN